MLKIPLLLLILVFRSLRWPQCLWGYKNKYFLRVVFKYRRNCQKKNLPENWVRLGLVLVLVHSDHCHLLLMLFIKNFIFFKFDRCLFLKHSSNSITLFVYYRVCSPVTFRLCWNFFDHILNTLKVSIRKLGKSKCFILWVIKNP